MLRGTAVKTHVLLMLGVVAIGSGSAGAQELPPPVVPPPAPQQVTATVDAPPAAPAPVNISRRREQIGLMEGLLAAAVRNGAQETARQIQAVQPGLTLFTGNARARGFHLEGYGVFFHVEIPGVQPSVEWILEALERSRVRQQGQPTLTTSGRGPAMLDANALYTEAVQQKLIDAMINLRIDLLPDEWLTVAARDGAGPLPGEIYESITMVLRVKGSDLADFLAGRTTREALRAKVEVREF
jgi:hypothetical protein